MIEIYTSNNPNENPVIVTDDDLRGYAESIADERCNQDESLDWSAIADKWNGGSWQAKKNRTSTFTRSRHNEQAISSQRPRRDKVRTL